jgi:hypothetical protein
MSIIQYMECLAIHNLVGGLTCLTGTQVDDETLATSSSSLPRLMHTGGTKKYAFESRKRHNKEQPKVPERETSRASSHWSTMTRKSDLVTPCAPDTLVTIL